MQEVGGGAVHHRRHIVELREFFDRYESRRGERVWATGIFDQTRFDLKRGLTFMGALIDVTSPALGPALDPVADQRKPMRDAVTVASRCARTSHHSDRLAHLSSSPATGCAVKQNVKPSEAGFFNLLDSLANHADGAGGMGHYKTCPTERKARSSSEKVFSTA